MTPTQKLVQEVRELSANPMTITKLTAQNPYAEQVSAEDDLSVVRSWS